jgi:O-antigen ligase
MRHAALVIVGLLLACPLFASDAGFDVLRLPAVLFLTATLLACAFVKSAKGGDRPPGPAPLRTAGMILLGAHLLSLIAARSITDAVAPILILFAGVAVFSCLRAGLLDRDAAEKLLPVIPAMGIVFAEYGLAQALMGREPVSTEGNRNYAGAICAILLPLSTALTLRGPRWSRVLSAVAAVSLAALLLLSQSRGGLLAALAGLVVAGTAMAVKRVPRSVVASAIAIFLLIGVVAFFQAGQFSQERMRTAGFRLDVWKSGLRMMEERPVLGWGSGGFSTEYPPFRSESEFRYSHEYPPVGFKELEDAHSSWVQTAVDTGALGLLALLLVVYVAARLWRYDVKVAPDSDRVAALAGLGGAAAAYLVAGLFNTLTLKTSPTLLFWIVLGLIEVLGESRPWRPSSRTKELRAAGPAAAAIVALFGAFWMSRMGLADGAFTQGMRTVPPAREAQLREALDYNPRHARARYELALTLSTLGRFAGAAEQGKAALGLRPNHAEGLILTAVSIHQAGLAESQSEAYFKRAIEIAPFYYKAWHNYGQFQRRRGNRAEARELFTRSIEHNPRFASSYFWRGTLSLLGGDGGSALDDFRRARLYGFDVTRALRAEFPATEGDPRFAELFQ